MLFLKIDPLDGGVPGVRERSWAFLVLKGEGWVLTATAADFHSFFARSLGASGDVFLAASDEQVEQYRMDLAAALHVEDYEGEMEHESCSWLESLPAAMYVRYLHYAELRRYRVFKESGENADVDMPSVDVGDPASLPALDERLLPPTFCDLEQTPSARPRLRTHALLPLLKKSHVYSFKKERLMHPLEHWLSLGVPVIDCPDCLLSYPGKASLERESRFHQRFTAGNSMNAAVPFALMMFCLAHMHRVDSAVPSISILQALCAFYFSLLAGSLPRYQLTCDKLLSQACHISLSYVECMVGWLQASRLHSTDFHSCPGPAPRILH